MVKELFRVQSINDTVLLGMPRPLRMLIAGLSVISNNHQILPTEAPASAPCSKARCSFGSKIIRIFTQSDEQS